MSNLIREYIEGNLIVREYESGTISKVAISDVSQAEPIEPQPTLEEIQTQTLLNTEYLVIMSELTSI